MLTNTETHNCSMFIEQEIVGCSALNVTSLSHLNVNLPQRFRDFGTGGKDVNKQRECMSKSELCLPEMTVQMHTWKHNSCARVHKTCTRPSQQNFLMEIGEWLMKSRLYLRQYW